MILRPLLSLGILLFATSVFSQLKFNVKAMPSGSEYGVFLKPCDGITPSDNIITGSGQVTLIIPSSNQMSLTGATHGTWVENGSVHNPVEGQGKSYYSYGFIANIPKVTLTSNEETLLFTVAVTGTGVPSLINNETDPFADLPNSANSNPGNDLSMLDVGVVPSAQYLYSGNYSDDDPNSCSSEPEVTSSFEEMEDKMYFNISPNPASQWLDVTLTSAETSNRIQIWAVDGTTVESVEMDNETKTRLEIGNLPNGVYFMGLISEGKVLQREKFMKQ